MLERVKSYFRHYRSERRGIIVLGVLILLSVAGVEAYRFFYKPKIEPIEVLMVSDENPLGATDGQDPHSKKKRQLFPFEPNTLNDSGYAALGFSEKEIKTLRNYQKAGGHFKIKKDFAKLFFVDEEEYAELEPFIELPETKPKKEYPKPSWKKEPENKVKWSDTASTQGFRYKVFTCNLNTADTTELKKVNGIGSFYARLIVERREELGGYYSLAQLLELWKMTPEKIDKFADRVIIDPNEIEKMPINSATAQELSGHPYLDFGKANKIVLKREESGGFSNAEVFCSTGLLDADLCRKLVPYLDFDQ